MVVSALTATFSVRTPRIDGRASTPERLKVKPADSASICDRSVMLRSASVAAGMAVTETLTSCWFSSRRLAVTLTVWISPVSAARAPACASAWPGAVSARAPNAPNVLNAIAMRAARGLR